MGDFFYGWKRKAGCVALALACLIASGWVRSFTSPDELIVPRTDPSIAIRFHSVSGDLWVEWMIWGCGTPKVNSMADWMKSRSIPTIRQFEKKSELCDWHFSWLGIGIATANDDHLSSRGMGMATATFIKIPYWIIVVPLIAFATWLLFSIHSSPKLDESKIDALVSGTYGPSIFDHLLTGWRRKFGILSAIAACTFIIWWARSLVVQDFIDLHSWARTEVEREAFAGVGTRRHVLALMKWENVTETFGKSETSSTTDLSLASFEAADETQPDLDQSIMTLLHSEPAPLKVETIKPMPQTTIRFWWIIAPLMALSWWLLFPKSGKR